MELDIATFFASVATSIVVITITVLYTTASTGSKSSSTFSKDNEFVVDQRDAAIDSSSTLPITVPGIYNEGNTCFMNSVIQSVSSLSALPSFLQTRILFLHKDRLPASPPSPNPSTVALKFSRYFSFFSPFATSSHSAETRDANSTIVIEALNQLTEDLSPRRDGITISKSNLVKALAAKGELNHLYGYHQQDAHEFFVHLSSKITDEDGKVPTIPNLFDSSLITNLNTEKSYGLYGNRRIDWRPSKMKRNPFMGLTVNVIICQACGHRPPSQHEVFYNLSITVPTHQHPSITSMINAYTSPETIDEYFCGKCSIIATTKKIQTKMEQTRLLKTISSDSKLDGAIKKELSLLEKSLKILQNAIKGNSFDTDHLKLPRGVELVKIMSVASKRITLAAAPQCLCIHLQRSIYLPETGHTLKNNAGVAFEKILDLNPFFLPNAVTAKSVTRSDFAETFLELQKQLGQKSALAGESSSIEPGRPVDAGKPQSIIPKNELSASISPRIDCAGPFVYHLTSVILHYGHHDSGHFVTLRRVVVGKKNGVEEVVWFRISDAHVERIADVSTDVFGHGDKYVYMLFYERH